MYMQAQADDVNVAGRQRGPLRRGEEKGPGAHALSIIWNLGDYICLGYLPRILVFQ